MRLLAAALIGGFSAWVANYVSEKEIENDLKEMYQDKYGSEWDEKIYPQGVVQNALGYGESPTLYYNSAESVVVSGDKKGKVISMIGSDPRLRKLTKDKDITPEEAAKRLEISAEWVVQSEHSGVLKTPIGYVAYEWDFYSPKQDAPNSVVSEIDDKIQQQIMLDVANLQFQHGLDHSRGIPYNITEVEVSHSGGGRPYFNITYSWLPVEIVPLHQAEQFAVEFDDWAEQEMKTHGYNISFREWAEEEGQSHGDEELLDWAQHEEESHDARYEAEFDDDEAWNNLDYAEFDDLDNDADGFRWFQECLFCDNDDAEELVEIMLDGDPEMICESCMRDIQERYEAESFGPVDEDGILAKALARARAKSKEPRRPLKITKLPHRNQKSLKDFEEFNSAIVYKKPKGVVAQVMAKEKALQQLALSEALLELEQYIRLGMITEEEAFRKIVQMSQ